MATVTKSPIDADVEICHSTFEDNVFLPEDYTDQLKRLIDEDSNYYQIYTLGHWGTLSERIYSNYKIIPELPIMEQARFGYGLDYGLVNESALVKIWIYNDKFYAEEKLYRKGMTVSDIVEFLSHQEQADLWADPTAKMQTAELRQAGYSAFDGHRGVSESIDLVMRQTIYIPESSANLIKEIRSYKWKKDKSGNVLPEPVKFNDHLMDAMRYGIWGLTERYGFAVARSGRYSGPVQSLSFGEDLGPNTKILERWMRRR